MLRWLKKSTARRTVIPLIEWRREWADQLTVHGEPFVEILAFWELYSKAQVAGALNKS